MVLVFVAGFALGAVAVAVARAVFLDLKRLRPLNIRIHLRYHLHITEIPYHIMRVSLFSRWLRRKFLLLLNLLLFHLLFHFLLDFFVGGGGGFESFGLLEVGDDSRTRTHRPLRVIRAAALRRDAPQILITTRMRRIQRRRVLHSFMQDRWSGGDSGRPPLLLHRHFVLNRAENPVS